MQTLYCGVDFHARTQTVAYCDGSDGQLHIKQLEHHTDELQQFYSQFKGNVIVGLEATGYSLWFETLIEELERFSFGFSHSFLKQALILGKYRIGIG